MSCRVKKNLGAALAVCISVVIVLQLTANTSWAKKKKGLAFGTITKFAAVPAVPGFPEGIAVHGNSVFVSGPATFGTAGTGPSAIQVYNRNTGQLDQTIVVQGEALQFEHAVSNIAIDGEGRIYALSTQLGLIRFTKHGHSYVQDDYGAPLPDLPAMGDETDFPPLVNDIVFDDDGNAYVTDSLQATIFRYGPSGGVPEIWFQSPLFVGGGGFPFGPNGIRLDPERQYVYMANTTSLAAPNIGTIYRLPLIDDPQPEDLEVVHDYVAGEAPDQLAFGEDGALYVTLAFSNQISILLPGDGEIGRIESQPGDDVPLDNPAAIAFDSRTKSLLLSNHAIFGDPANFAVLSAYIGDPGDPLSEP